MMKTNPTRLLSFAAGVMLAAAPFSAAVPEDIDIFAEPPESQTNKPNVLIVIDNSANWSRESQKWPDGTQGQSEVRAIKKVIESLPDGSVNLGLMLHRTDGSSSENDNAYVRFHVRPMTGSITDPASNKGKLGAHLDTIDGAINDPEEKRNSGNPFGNLFWDIHNYLAGDDSIIAGAGTEPVRADEAAYDSNYDNFRSPLQTADTCTRTVVIFIGNNVSSGPTTDSLANQTALLALQQGTSLEGNTGPVPFAEFAVTTTPTTTTFGPTADCFGSVAACNTAVSGMFCDDNGLTNCACDPGSAMPCSTFRFEVFGVPVGVTTTTETDKGFTDTPNRYTGEATNCSKNQPNQACTLPPGTDITYDPNQSANPHDRVETSWVGACTWTDTTTGCGGQKTIWEPRGTLREHRFEIQTTSTGGDPQSQGVTAACFNELASCDPSEFAECSANPPPGDPDYQSCFCASPGDDTGCPDSSNSRYAITGDYNRIEAQATGNFVASDADLLADEWARFLRQVGVTIPGQAVKNKVTTYTLDAFKEQQNDDFSAYMFNIARLGGGKYYQTKSESEIEAALQQIFTEVQAVNSAFSSASLPVNATNRSQNKNEVYIGLFRPGEAASPSWFGNLKRYQLDEEQGRVFLADLDGKAAISSQTGFFSDCTRSYWTAHSNPDAYWQSVQEDAPDAQSLCELDTTGFEYADKPWSDLPDGPFVEKGAVSYVLRHGNVGHDDSSQAAPTGGPFTVERDMYTAPELPSPITNPQDPPVFWSSTDSADLAATPSNAGSLSAETVRYTFGEDQNDEDTDAPAGAFDNDPALIEPRSTIHGDVVHSRPQPVDHDSGVVIYYGANDGSFRAVQSSDGKELWSFIAPEHFDKLDRLRTKSPVINYFGSTVAGAQPKNYFFDGSTGVFQSSDNNDVWIFPSMRRGGRMIYGIEVDDHPGLPKLKWRLGCPNLFNDTDCTTNGNAAAVEKIGQTWSTPNVARIAGYTDVNDVPKPVLIFGGGYDTCEDQNTKTPTCTGADGSGVFVVDADDGTVVKFFDFAGRSVAADVTLVDVTFDELVDHAYAVDTGGNIWRMDFVDTNRNAQASADWAQGTLGSATAGSGRKFLFAPAIVQAAPRSIYVAVGSGDREAPTLAQYPFTTPVMNRFYVLIDDLNVAANAVTTVSMDDTAEMKDHSNADCDTPPVLPGQTEKGWFIDLDQNGVGEQVVSSAVIVTGSVLFSTNRPTPASNVACTSSLGEARGYFLNLLTGSGQIGEDGTCGGSQSSTFVGGGLPPSPVVATVDIGGVTRTVVIGGAQKDGSISSSIEAQRAIPIIDSTRQPVYWYKSTGGQ